MAEVVATEKELLSFLFFFLHCTQPTDPGVNLRCHETVPVLMQMVKAVNFVPTNHSCHESLSKWTQA